MTKAIRFDGETLRLVPTLYHDGNTAITVVTAEGEPYARLSVNVPESANLPTRVFYLKDWSENAALADHLIRNGHIRRFRAARPALTGFEMVEAYVLR